VTLAILRERVFAGNIQRLENNTLREQSRERFSLDGLSEKSLFVSAVACWIKI
jgi:hypothetical protein